VGRLSAFHWDPAWQDGVKETIRECEFCGQEFRPERIAQPYCSNECGLKANKQWYKVVGGRNVPVEFNNSNNSNESLPADGSSGWTETSPVSEADGKGDVSNPRTNEEALSAS